MNTDSQPVPPSILIDRERIEKILGASFKVLNTLGAGSLEKVYENALSIELRRNGYQKASHVSYRGTIVGGVSGGLNSGRKGDCRVQSSDQLGFRPRGAIAKLSKGEWSARRSIDQFWQAETPISETGSLKGQNPCLSVCIHGSEDPGELLR